MSKKEELLYPDIEAWCKKYLEDKYKRYSVTTTHKTSRVALDSYLKTIGIEVKDAIGLSIRVDIVGVLRKSNETKLVFIEVKDNPLTLTDLGQLWGYTQLIDPVESFLVSSKGLGSLEYLLKVIKREDLLAYGIKKEKMMRVCKWDEGRKAIDYSSLIPKL
ncbi:MAG: hypothetical protein PHO67_05185 [Candidatus Omnitrophica bacterium]|nr:hypothetical protein [Candidatus Omnitrophota bacterium]